MEGVQAMRHSITKIIGLFLCLFSLSAFADRMLITGRPVLLDLHEGFFVLPSNYIAPVGYRFVRFTETNRVCFLNSMPQFKSLDMVQITLQEKGDIMNWKCYEYSPKFFEVDY
jgi:hypothetical protein